jgi:hypothetical protein
VNTQLLKLLMLIPKADSPEELEVPYEATKPAIDPKALTFLEEEMGVYETSGPEAQVANKLGIDDADIAWAKMVGRKYGGALDGRGDAARHIALGWLARNSKNPKLAKELISLREVANSSWEAGMDRHNNLLGWEIESSSYQDAEQQIDELLEAKARFYKLAESKKKRGY